MTKNPQELPSYGPERTPEYASILITYFFENSYRQNGAVNFVG
jgi:hypothetical protein